MTKHLKKISKYKPSALQGQFRFAVSQPRQGLAIEHPFERLAFPLLFLVLFALIGSYLYLVAQATLNVMAEREANVASNTLETSIAQLEQQYFAISATLTQQDASQLGLTPIQQIAYVHRPGSTALSSVSNNEI